MAAQVLSIDAFNEEEFEQRIDHIDVEEDRLEFYFRDGHSVTDHWPIPRRKKMPKITKNTCINQPIHISTD